MYAPSQIKALEASNFDFTTFDWRTAKAALKWQMAATRAENNDKPMPELPEGYIHPRDVRALHVLYSLARGRPIVGERGIEQPNTREPMTAARLKFELARFQLEEVKAA